MAIRNSADGVALVTGATGGMGSESVKALAAAGWDEFLLCDIDEARLDAVAAPLRAAGAKVDVLAGNIADPSCPGQIVAALAGRPISAVVHTAGVGPNGGTPAQVLDINYAATIRFVNEIAKLADPQRRAPARNAAGRKPVKGRSAAARAGS